jgi:hypothetical protein
MSLGQYTWWNNPYPDDDGHDIDALCEECGSEGRIYRGQYEDERDCGECPACKGRGVVLLPTKPITEEDLDEAWPEFSDYVPF